MSEKHQLRVPRPSSARAGLDLARIRKHRPIPLSRLVAPLFQSALIALVGAVLPPICLSQETPSKPAQTTAPQAPNASASRPPSSDTKNAPQPKESERRRASTLYLAGAKLYE